LNESGKLPYPLVYKGTAKSNAEITGVVRSANYDKDCTGVITWCHTFSPSKMWINGLNALQKPYCHLATQYNVEIPNEEIDMDFMNLNQAAHGDREHGFLGARLRKARKVIAGHWKDATVQDRLGAWMRTAVGVAVSRELKVMRFGDNMREVAVTEGDKVEAQIKLGWQVNTWAVGDLVKEMNAVTEAEVDALMADYTAAYDVATENVQAIRYQAREEIAMKKMMDREGCMAFTNTFQDLYGMEQLPGLASQHLMAQGYGYGGEGDWKVSAMTAIMKAMGENGNGASGFMEDYTYHLVEDNRCSLGAHMLEVCPSMAGNKPRIETHHLGIGMNEKDPARLVFEGKAGSAIVVSLVDMGGRMRLICQDVECIKPILDMPNLPVARVMWKPAPDLLSGIECWILAGGAHHTVLSYDVSAEQMRDFANCMDIEFVHITKDTTPESLEKELLIADLAWKLK
ncbi:MAG: L-arabinose isomerase, partial [Clostridia bacterium]|nr:L-arabinose isomerase [Clostridia bacterium]